MAGILYDGVAVPYTSVSTEYARNPAMFTYSSTPRYSTGGVRLRNIRLDMIEDMVIARIERPRGSNKSWDEIKTEIHAVLLMHDDFKPLAFNYAGENGNKFYLARIKGIRYYDEREYSANAEITFMCEFPYRFGNERTINVTATKTNQTIHGQIPTHWKVTSTFTVDAETYEFEANGGIVKLTYPIRSGDVLEIDYINRTILINGEDKAVALNLETRWPKIKPGADAFRASNPSQLKYNEIYY